MKIAIMLSGQPRFNREFSDLLENLQNCDQIDLFFYLSDTDHTEVHWIPPTWPKDYNSIREKIQSNIPANAQIADLQILPQPAYNVTKSYNLTPWSIAENIWHTYNGIKQVNLLREEYEKINGSYDLIIKTRPDVGVSTPLNCIDIKNYLNLYPNTIIMPNDHRFGMHGNPVNDLIGIGTGSTMSIYCSAIDYFDQYHDQGTVYHGETLLSRHLSTNNIQTPQTNFNCNFREYWQKHKCCDYGVWI
jgi:hypothetical protein